MKKLNPFDILNGLNRKQLFTKEQVKESGLSSYLLINFIKSHPVLLKAGLYLNKNYKMDLYNQYLFVFLTFKRFNISGVRWIKSEKMHNPENIEIVMRYYSIGYKTANEYLNTLSKEKVNEIREYYDLGGRR